MYLTSHSAGPGKLAAATSRKGALKRADGEPLTRQDLQYDLLNYIFSDTNAVFTDPFSNPPGQKVTFRDLYVSAIARAPKTARSVRDKFAESEVFATDFAMLSLLANVGRVNTSMACESDFPLHGWLPLVLARVRCPSVLRLLADALSPISVTM